MATEAAAARPIPAAAEDHHSPFGGDSFGREAENKRVEAYEAKQAQLLDEDKTMGEQHSTMLAQNTHLTEQVAALTRELHKAICSDGAKP